jgi:hypothetical protein
MREEELADTGFGRQEPDNPAQEAPVLHRRPAQPGHQREHLLRRDPVRLELAADYRLNAALSGITLRFLGGTLGREPGLIPIDGSRRRRQP